MNKTEYNTIYNHIMDTSYEIHITFNRKERLIIAEELLDWLKKNGGCVLIKEDKKRLKTKDKVICTYMAKWGVKFQVTKEFKYHNVSNVEVKILTKNQLDKGSD